MITRVSEVQKVTITTSTELWSNVVEKPIVYSDTEFSLPLSIRFNSEWSIAHECLQCTSQCVWSYSGRDKFVLHPLFTKYYHKELLEEFATVLNGVTLAIPQNLSHTFLIDGNVPDYSLNSLEFPTFNLAIYSCLNCLQEYVSKYRIALPLEISREFPEGKLGTLFLDSIMSVQMTGQTLQEHVKDQEVHR